MHYRTTQGAPGKVPENTKNPRSQIKLMSITSKSFRLFIASLAIIAITSVTVTTASASTGYSVVDSVLDFFGMATTETPQSTTAPEPMGVAATTLIDPAGDGGFETGADFPLN